MALSSRNWALMKNIGSDCLFRLMIGDAGKDKLWAGYRRRMLIKR